jgi:hypothetical protein
MINSYQYLDIDINKKTYKRLRAVQGDSKSRYILASLYDNSKAYNLSNCSVKVFGCKSDKKIFFNYATVTDATNGKFKIELTNQALAVAGELQIQILILGSNQERLTSFVFYIDIEKSIVSDDVIESTNEFRALTGALSQVEEWNGYFEETSGKIEEKYTERLSYNEEKISVLDSQLEHIENTKANITDLTSNRQFKGSKTTAEILALTGNNGDYYYSTDESVYYKYNGANWSNIGVGNTLENKANILFPPQIENKYLKPNGTFVDLVGTNFLTLELDVSYNQRFLINCSCRDNARIYSFVDKNGVVISTYPSESGNLQLTTMNSVITIPKDCVKLRVCTYKSGNVYHISTVAGQGEIVESLDKVVDYVDNNIQTVDLIEENRFINSTGGFSDITSASFRSIELNVTENERFNVKGSVKDLQRLYSLVDNEGKVIKVFPNQDGKLILTKYNQNITIPKDCVKLRVCSYNDFENNVTILPILKIPTAEEKVEILECNYLLNKVMCIGDSLTEGAYFDTSHNGATIIENYPYYLAKMNKFETINAGTSGISASGWYENKRTLYPISECDTFIIWLGTNNGYTDTLEEDTASGDYNTYANTETGYYCKIIEYIQEKRPNANIFLCKIFASKSNVNTSNLVLDKIAVKYNLPVINMNDGTLYNKSNVDIQNLLHPFDNSVHFGKIGNLTVARKISNFINEYINNNLSQFEHIYIS